MYKYFRDCYVIQKLSEACKVLKNPRWVNDVNDFFMVKTKILQRTATENCMSFLQQRRPKNNFIQR